MRDGVIFPFRWGKSLLALPDAELRQMLNAIFEYAENGNEPQFSGIMLCAWLEYRDRIRSDAENYERLVEQRREAGKKGVEVKRKQSLAKLSKGQQSLAKLSKGQQSLAKLSKGQQSLAKQAIGIGIGIGIGKDTHSSECVTAPAREYPQSLQQLKDICHQFGISMSDEALESYWNIRVASDWVNANGVKVKNVPADLKVWSVREKQKQIEAERKASQNGQDYSRNFSGDYTVGIHDTADDF